MPTARAVLLALLAAAVAVVGTALLSQYVGGLYPCELCLAERWPYYIAIAVAAVALLVFPRFAVQWIGLLALIFLVSAGLGAYHVGVEQGWIAGPTACTGGNTGVAKTAEDLLKLLQQQQVVRCDEIQWSLAGISLAGWNVVASLLLLVFAASGCRRAARELAR
jgi:disulfide bond formation protein DsbB